MAARAFAHAPIAAAAHASLLSHSLDLDSSDFGWDKLSQILHGVSSGDKLGPYELVSPIGAGGVGEVYRAHDSKLNRDRVVKVLPASLAKDADFLARFQREAQTLASLNHPNIATIHGLEANAIVMELVEGSVLSGPLPMV